MEANEILKELREDRGLTMKEVSEATKMSTPLISDYETGKKAMGMKVAIRFADYYNVSLDYLMGRTTVKQMATEQPDPLADIDVSALEKRIIKKYTEFNDFERAVCVELLRQLTTVFDDEKPPQPVEPPKPDIQVSQIRSSGIAIARGGNGFKPAPTKEQIASFIPVPEDEDL